ncbi:hypothetical protein CLOM_g15160 [Closterium sp. NIES-68]|nr:hypothetical protein CLOM_g15160 [Closterium sp. NIES-68]GJP59068.1 hypothetical protein CLOP_g7146 [Closterium sp. NIES-67]
MNVADVNVRNSSGNSGGPSDVIESWEPREDRYLLALCFYGRLSNQEVCMRSYLIFAALLNRTLLVPDPGFAHHFQTWYRWRWSLIFDIPHLRACLADAYGNNTVLTVEELVSRTNQNVTVDHIACAEGRSCMDEIQLSFAKLPNVTLPDKLEHPLESGRQDINSFRAAYAPYANTRVLSLGNIYGLLLNGKTGKMLHETKPPFRTSCLDLWEPPPVVRQFVSGFIDTFLGDDFAAVHMRRGDFSHAYLRNEEKEQNRNPAFLPIASIARYIVSRLSGRGISILYLATDASLAEVQFLEKLLLELDSKAPFIVERLPQFSKGSLEYKESDWVRDFEDLDEEDKGILKALAEKHICARAQYFIGTPKSTFSSDIIRIREVEGRASTVDSYLGDSG